MRARRPAAAGAVPAALRACLAWLLLLGQASAVVDGSGQRRPHRRELPQAQSRIPRHELRVTKARSRSFSPAAPELAMEDLLGSCGFTLADLPETGARWHTASSACSVLGKLDRLVFVGDSVTRQVRPRLPLARPARRSCAQPAVQAANSCAGHCGKPGCAAAADLPLCSVLTTLSQAGARSCTRRWCSCCAGTCRAARCARTRPRTSSSAARATSRPTRTAASTRRPGRPA